ncbi:LTA synthase family protein [Alteribacillus bidgolensis]|uniref:Phosphoglycerol transferase MdoB n=1 Tax=Alteribacillus bidgolensis TaxID=930129 RepID=A0A1G8FTA4_9BACI|nr:LTA synthase family protein [Alteribacillus bidgolensis]SDH85331.1 Phosphoglycerol transferase MdoB [Alteribacillus bidgolensis]
MKSLFNRQMWLYILLIYLKTILVTLVLFQTVPSTWFQWFTFMLNPIIFLFLVFSFGLFFNQKWQHVTFFIISLLVSIVLYSNAVHYREFSDLITVPMLAMSANMGDLSTSIVKLIRWYDIFLFLDLLIILWFLNRKSVQLPVQTLAFRQWRGAAVFIAVFMVISTFLSQTASIENVRHSFDRQRLVSALGLYNYYIYDTFMFMKSQASSTFAKEDDWEPIDKHIENHEVETNKEYFGAAKDRNIVVISLESFESFVIGNTVDGKELTPNLNQLIDESYYFKNFYHQTGQGKTSDAEFLINTSLYPAGSGAVFLKHPDNKIEGLPDILSSRGYSTASFHANDRSFYNREDMYDTLGYDKYFSKSYYDISEDDEVGWGMKDEAFFDQAIDHLHGLDEPFYGTFLTLTNHFPYELEEEDRFIEPLDSESEVLNNYVSTVRYTDEAIGNFIEKLKDNNMYENTMFVIYGDHYGIADSHNDAMGEFLNKEIDAYENAKLQRVPLIIHIPGMEGKTLDVVSGQVDVMPTILNLLGISVDDYTMFGRDLFSEEREDFVVFRDGSVIDEEVIYTADTCYDRENGEEISMDHCNEAVDKGNNELYYSDKIVYGDLFRYR